MICRCEFMPDARVGERQRACGRAECQEARRQGSQASWRRRNPGYFIARRAKQRASDNKTELVEAPRAGPPLSRLPWELAQEEFGIAGADFLGSMGRLLVTHAKDQIRAETPYIPGKSAQSDGVVAKDEIRGKPRAESHESGR